MECQTVKKARPLVPLDFQQTVGKKGKSLYASSRQRQETISTLNLKFEKQEIRSHAKVQFAQPSPSIVDDPETKKPCLQLLKTTNLKVENKRRLKGFTVEMGQKFLQKFKGLEKEFQLYQKQAHIKNLKNSLKQKAIELKASQISIELLNNYREYAELEEQLTNCLQNGKRWATQKLTELQAVSNNLTDTEKVTHSLQLELEKLMSEFDSVEKQCCDIQDVLYKSAIEKQSIVAQRQYCQRDIEAMLCQKDSLVQNNEIMIQKSKTNIFCFVRSYVQILYLKTQKFVLQCPVKGTINDQHLKSQKGRFEKLLFGDQQSINMYMQTVHEFFSELNDKMICKDWQQLQNIFTVFIELLFMSNLRNLNVSLDAIHSQLYWTVMINSLNGEEKRSPLANNSELYEFLRNHSYISQKAKDLVKLLQIQSACLEILGLMF